MLDWFPFDDADMYPYSPVLEEAMANMQIYSDLQRKNPDMDEFQIAPYVEDYYKKVIQEKLDQEQLREIEEISRHFADRLR